jgi:hypothetical protein
MPLSSQKCLFVVRNAFVQSKMPECSLKSLILNKNGCAWAKCSCLLKNAFVQSKMPICSLKRLKMAVPGQNALV